MDKSRYIVLNCEDAEKWRGHEELFVRTFDSASPRHSTANRRKWEYYKCFDMQLPKDEEIQTIAALIITGSHHDCWRDTDWIVATCNFVKKAVDGGVRAVGVCFGCQLLGRALGGKVDHNPNGRFMLGTEFIRPTAELLKRKDFVEALRVSKSTSENVLAMKKLVSSDNTSDETLNSIKPYLKVLESHGDQIVIPPPDATLLASSDSTQYELWCVETETKHALAMQFHPELWKEIIVEKIGPALLKNGKMVETELKKCSELMDAHSPDSTIIVDMVRRFLYSEEESSQTVIHEKMDELFHAISDAVDAELAIVKHDYDMVSKMNKVATAKYNEMADFTAGLTDFAESISAKMSQFSQYEAVVEEMEQQLVDLEAVVGQLDMCTGRLEDRMRSLPMTV